MHKALINKHIDDKTTAYIDSKTLRYCIICNTPIAWVWFTTRPAFRTNEYIIEKNEECLWCSSCKHDAFKKALHLGDALSDDSDLVGMCPYWTLCLCHSCKVPVRWWYYKRGIVNRSIIIDQNSGWDWCKDCYSI